MKKSDLRNIIKEELEKILETDTAQKIRNYADRIRKLSDKISKSNNPEERRRLTQVKARAEQDRQKLVKGIGAKPMRIKESIINEDEKSNLKLFNQAIKLRTVWDEILYLMGKAINDSSDKAESQELIDLKEKFRKKLNETNSIVDLFRKKIFK